MYFFCLVQLRLWFFVASLNSYLIYYTDDDKDKSKWYKSCRNAYKTPHQCCANTRCMSHCFPHFPSAFLHNFRHNFQQFHVQIMFSLAMFLKHNIQLQFCPFLFSILYISHIVETYSQIFGLVQFFGFIFAPFTGLIMNIQPRNTTNEFFGPMLSFIITLLLCFILSALVLVPVLEIQVGKFKQTKANRREPQRRICVFHTLCIFFCFSILHSWFKLQ